MVYFYSPIFCKIVLIYFIHWIISFKHYIEISCFISFKLLKLGRYILYFYIIYSIVFVSFIISFTMKSIIYIFIHCLYYLNLILINLIIIYCLE